MKVNLIVSKDIEESYADIHTNELTEDITKAIIILENSSSNDMLAVKKDDSIVLLEFENIFMVRVEDGKVKVFTQSNDYIIKKPLYQVEEILTKDFVRISKTTIINIRKIQRVTPSLKGMMFVEHKNDLKDNISRKYLPFFKEALDL